MLLVVAAGGDTIAASSSRACLHAGLQSCQEVSGFVSSTKVAAMRHVNRATTFVQQLSAASENCLKGGRSPLRKRIRGVLQAPEAQLEAVAAVGAGDGCHPLAPASTACHMRGKAPPGLRSLLTLQHGAGHGLAWLWFLSEFVLRLPPRRTRNASPASQPCSGCGPCCGLSSGPRLCPGCGRAAWSRSCRHGGNPCPISSAEISGPPPGRRHQSAARRRRRRRRLCPATRPSRRRRPR